MSYWTIPGQAFGVMSEIKLSRMKPELGGKGMRESGAGVQGPSLVIHPWP